MQEIGLGYPHSFTATAVATGGAQRELANTRFHPPEESALLSASILLFHLLSPHSELVPVSLLVKKKACCGDALGAITAEESEAVLKVLELPFS